MLPSHLWGYRTTSSAARPSSFRRARNPPVTARDRHEDEGNAYARLGEVLGRLGREDEARDAYEAGIRQAEKFGHSGMAEDLRAALVNLRE
jgi:hypothetical protein